MLQAQWVFGGVIVGMLFASVFRPPARIERTVPSPHDKHTYRTDVGCIRLVATEVPCGAEPVSFNRLAST